MKYHISQNRLSNNTALVLKMQIEIFGWSGQRYIINLSLQSIIFLTHRCIRDHYSSKLYKDIIYWNQSRIIFIKNIRATRLLN
jgi:hypothetical protein